MFRQIPEVGFFEKNQFFIFLSPENQFFSNVRGPQKILWVPRPFLASKIMVKGVPTSSISLYQHWFLVLFWSKLASEIFSDQEMLEV